MNTDILLRSIRLLIVLVLIGLSITCLVVEFKVLLKNGELTFFLLVGIAVTVMILVGLMIGFILLICPKVEAMDTPTINDCLSQPE